MARPGSLLVLALVAGLALPLLARGEDPEVKVTIDAEDEPLIAVVKKLCAARGLDYVASEAALQQAGRVSLKLTDVPLSVALETICDVYSLDAHMHGKIVVIKAREGAHPAPRRVEEPALPRPVRETPPAPPPATVPAPAAAPAPAPVAEVTSQTPARPQAAMNGAMVVGSVVEVAADSVTVKEDKGEPRVFTVVQTNDDNGRAMRLLQALKRLKKGDRIALMCNIDGTRAVVVDLVAGGKLAQ